MTISGFFVCASDVASCNRHTSSPWCSYLPLIRFRVSSHIYQPLADFLFMLDCNFVASIGPCRIVRRRRFIPFREITIRWRYYAPLVVKLSVWTLPTVDNFPVFFTQAR